MVEQGPTTRATVQQIPTGIEGLDFILRGGLPRGRTYVIQGDPGVGKTTLGLHFVLAGVEAGERVLYVTISQTAEELAEIAHSHSWSLDGVDVLELSRASVREQLAQRQSILRPEELELSETTMAVQERIGEIHPTRLVFDSIGAIRVLAGGMSPRYRQEINLLLQILTESEITALILDDMPADADDIQFQTLAHGVIKLLYDSYAYADIRTLRVLKMRGLQYMGGTHSFELQPEGVIVFPRLQNLEYHEYDEWRVVQSGVEELDLMLGGGLEMGTSCLITGSTGTGKSSLATLYLYAALEAGEKGAAFLFDERQATFFRRAESLNMDLRPYLQNGQLVLEEVDTGAYSASEFGQATRAAVNHGASVILIDSLTGYYHAMKQEEELFSQMHEILAYLSRRGVLSLLVARETVEPDNDGNTLNLSYMADAILLLRLFEAGAEVRKAISVRKKRHSDHENQIREFLLTPAGVRVGAPLDTFEDVLSARPTYTGGRGQLLDKEELPQQQDGGE